jgi:hypothetical protein
LAAANSFDTQPAAAKRAMLLQGFYCVTRTTGVKTAMRRHQRTDKQAVKTDAGNEQALHID